jgi:hypothetical protein
MEEYFPTYLQVQFSNIKNIIYKKSLQKYYNRICEFFDPVVNTNKYIFYALHYQPEETTCPSAGHFCDQYHIISCLVELLPPNLCVVVKEHRSQFNRKLEGHAGRDKMFYDDLRKLPRVKLVSEKSNPFELIDNSLAVATATGTIGWESLIRNKPVLIFGNAWYEYCNNVFRIHNKEDLKFALQSIISGTLSSQNPLVFLKAISKNVIKGYHYKGYVLNSAIDQESCINNLVKGFAENLKLQYE